MKKNGGNFVTCIAGWDYLFQTMQCGNVVWVWKYKETAEGFAHPFLEFIMYRLERSSGVTKNRLTSVEYDEIYSLEGSESALQKPLVSKVWVSLPSCLSSRIIECIHLPKTGTKILKSLQLIQQLGFHIGSFVNVMQALFCLCSTEGANIGSLRLFYVCAGGWDFYPNKQTLELVLVPNFFASGIATRECT